MELSAAKSEHEKFLTEYRKIFENFNHASISPPIVSKDAQLKVTSLCKFWKQFVKLFRKNNNNNSNFSVWKRSAHFALLSVAQAMHWCVLPLYGKLMIRNKYSMKKFLVLIISLVDIWLESWKWAKIDRIDFFVIIIKIIVIIIINLKLFKKLVQSLNFMLFRSNLWLLDSFGV